MTNRRIWVIHTILLFGFVILQGCVVSNPNIIKAEEKIEQKEYDAAVEYYTKAANASPEDHDIKVRLKDAKQKASLQHMLKAQELIEKKFYREAIEELQVSVAFYSGNHRAIELVDHVKSLKESQYFSQKGYQQIKTGDYEGAKKSFQKALKNNPKNEDALFALEKFKHMPDKIPEYQLELRNNDPLSLKFKKTPILNVFEILSKLSGVNFIFDKDLKESKVTLFMTDVAFDRFLDVLLQTNSLKAKLINPKTMLIYPDTPAKAKEYDDLYVKTFYLSYLKAKSAVTILTKILKNKDIIANEKLNAITVRGPKSTVEMAERIVKANDLTPSEVVLNVEILEVGQDKEKDLGLSISDTITFGISEPSTGIDFDTDFGLASFASIKDISNISSNEIYMSLPTATLKLLKRDGDTKILAKPQVRVSSSEKASVLIGERVPLRSNRTVQTDGTTTFDFVYQDVGVKLNAEPVINMYNQVTMKLEIEISTLGTNVGTVTDPQFSIRTRTTKTVLTVYDGDSVIIGGLIQDEDRRTIQKIPGLGEIPAIGRLFSNENSEIDKTDILMTITPIIIRNKDIPETKISEFWSGQEKEISLKEPVEEKIKKEAEFTEFPDEEFIMVYAEDEFLPSDEYFSIQVYSSKDEQDAEKRSKELEEMNYQTWVRPIEIRDKGKFFRVFIGQYHSFQKAVEAREGLLKTNLFPKDIHIVDKEYVYGE